MNAPVHAIPDGFYCRKDKRNVYLIGDSMKRGSAPFIRRELSDIAEVFYNDCNCANSQTILVNLGNWIAKFDDRKKVDLVQFNCGHWDVSHMWGCSKSLTSEAEYEDNLRKIIELLRKFFVNAKIVFATTCPMNPDGSNDPNHPRYDEEIERYNGIAVRVMQEEGVEINDMHAIMRPYGSELYYDYCHLSMEGFELLGIEAAKNLRKLL